MWLYPQIDWQRCKNACPSPCPDPRRPAPPAWPDPPWADDGRCDPCRRPSPPRPNPCCRPESCPPPCPPPCPPRPCEPCRRPACDVDWSGGEACVLWEDGCGNQIVLVRRPRMCMANGEWVRCRRHA